MSRNERCSYGRDAAAGAQVLVSAARGLSASPPRWRRDPPPRRHYRRYVGHFASPPEGATEASDAADDVVDLEKLLQHLELYDHDADGSEEEGDSDEDEDEDDEGATADEDAEDAEDADA